MKKQISNIVARVTGRKNLGHIVSGFTSTVRDLRALSTRNQIKRGKNFSKIEVLRTHNRALDNESAHAVAIADNIESLLS